MKKALITGIGGMDGSHLTDLLLQKGYEVHGIIRRASNFNTGRIDHVFENPNLHIHHGDLTDSASISDLVARIQPDEVYNLGAQSHVAVSFAMPSYTAQTIVQGTLNMLEAVRHHCPKARFYQASSSEMFGRVLQTPQTETTPFNPRSPYGCAKACAHYLTVNYRESYGLHASCGILFNHEGPRRGKTFVTRKITTGIARILAGKQTHIRLGNLDACRDWGLAEEYVRAQWLMLQQDKPDDYVIATGRTYSVRNFVEYAFRLAELDWRTHVIIDQKYFRPAEVDLLLGDPSKAVTKLGWKPETTFWELVKRMLEADCSAEGVTLPR